eukprot:Rhum_TRINITY_DN20684_c0_g1::Rhum_TRINITY_DN20684_c0_g1_i1::g.171789::m.171789
MVPPVKVAVDGPLPLALSLPDRLGDASSAARELHKVCCNPLPLQPCLELSMQLVVAHHKHSVQLERAGCVQHVLARLPRRHRLHDEPAAPRAAVRRVARLDRIGQRRHNLVVHLVAARVHRRVAVAEADGRKHREALQRRHRHVDGHRSHAARDGDAVVRDVQVREGELPVQPRRVVHQHAARGELAAAGAAADDGAGAVGELLRVEALLRFAALHLEDGVCVRVVLHGRRSGRVDLVVRDVLQAQLAAMPGEDRPAGACRKIVQRARRHLCTRYFRKPAVLGDQLYLARAVGILKHLVPQFTAGLQFHLSAHCSATSPPFSPRTP